MPSSQGHPCSCPLQQLQLTTSRCTTTHIFIPWTTLLSQPLQHLNVTPNCRRTADLSTRGPGTLFLSQPLQHLKVAIFCSTARSKFIPWTTLLSGPLQNFKVASLRSVCTCRCLPVTSFLSQPLHTSRWPFSAAEAQAPRSLEHDPASRSHNHSIISR